MTRCSIFSTVQLNYGLLLELHTLTLAACSYTLLTHHIHLYHLSGSSCPLNQAIKSSRREQSSDQAQFLLSKPWSWSEAFQQVTHKWLLFGPQRWALHCETLTEAWHSVEVNVKVYSQLLPSGCIHIQLLPHLHTHRWRADKNRRVT